MRGGTRRWVALWLVGAAGCALVRAPAPPPITDGVQVGVASWYGPGFHGNRTANGEIYDQYELTAAHPSGSYTVEVAALSDPDKAAHLRQVLAHRFPDAFVTPLAGTSGHYYRVRIGPYPLRTAALERAERIVRLGYPAIIIDERAP